MPTPPRTTDAALQNASRIWVDEFARRHPDEMRHAVLDCAVALLGRLPNEHDRDLDIGGSLPGVWGAFLRPMKDGRRGVDLAAKHGRFKSGVLAAAIARIRESRAIFADVVSLDAATRTATLKDVWDGQLYRVELQPHAAMRVTRWMRLFGLVTDCGDGHHYHLSTLDGHAWMRNVDPARLVEAVNEHLAAFGLPEPIDPAAPHAGLTRWVGVVRGILMKLLAPTAEQQAELAKKVYVVNTDGQRFEHHEATARLPIAASTALREALDRADDFVREEGWAWVGDRKPSSSAVGTERVAGVVPQRDGRWSITTNSKERFQALLGRLAALAGAPLEVEKLETIRPWEGQPNAAAEDGPDVRKVTVATSVGIDASEEGAHAAWGAMVRELPRRMLDEDVPLLGGVPRELVKTPEGRAKVEKWLFDQEVQGLPANGPVPSYLDLDAVREELGLPRAFG